MYWMFWLYLECCRGWNLERRYHQLAFCLFVSNIFISCLFFFSSSAVPSFMCQGTFYRPQLLRRHENTTISQFNRMDLLLHWLTNFCAMHRPYQRQNYIPNKIISSIIYRRRFHGRKWHGRRKYLWWKICRWMDQGLHCPWRSWIAVQCQCWTQHEWVSILFDHRQDTVAGLQTWYVGVGEEVATRMDFVLRILLFVE